jgi:hypothetical protein
MNEEELKNQIMQHLTGPNSRIGVTSDGDIATEVWVQPDLLVVMLIEVSDFYYEVSIIGGIIDHQVIEIDNPKKIRVHDLIEAAVLIPEEVRKHFDICAEDMKINIHRFWKEPAEAQEYIDSEIALHKIMTQGE